MQDTSFDDGYESRTPTFRDHDADLASMVKEDASIPDEVKSQHDEMAKEAFPYLKDNAEAAKEVLANANAAYCVDEHSPEAKAVHAAARAEAATPPDASQAPGTETPAAPVVSPADPSAEESRQTAATPAASSADKPTSLESALSLIRTNGQRQQRLIISGDPQIERAFYEKLAERGQVFYQGGAPVITISREKAIKVLMETAKEFSGASAQHAVSLQLDRDHGGIGGTVNSALANMPGALARKIEGDGTGDSAIDKARSFAAGVVNSLARRHEIDVVVVGKPDVIDAKLKELGSLALDMERNGHVKAGTASVEDGKLQLSSDKPLELNGTARLTAVLTAAYNKVDNYNTEQAAIQRDVKAFKQEESVGKMEKSRKERNEGADEASGKASPERPNKHSNDLAAAIDKGFQDPNVLRAQNGKRQVNAVAFLQQARSLQDPTVRELQTLPDATRQKAIVQMAALVAKVDAKDFGDKLPKELDSHKKDSSSIRQKVDAYIDMEAKRDPQFAENVKPLLKDMVERNILTESQAEAITGKVAEAVTAAKDSAAKDVPVADAPKAAELSKDGATVEAGKDKVPTLLKDMVEKGELTETQAQFVTGKVLETAAAAKEAEAGTNKDGAVVKSTNTEASATESRSAADDKAVTGPAAEGKAPSADNSSALAAKSTSPAEGVKDVRVEPTLGEPATAGKAADVAPKASSEAPAQGLDKPLNLRDRIEALAKDGPANLTVEKAHALVADLDGIRSKPLTALDGGKGTEPTRTLVRAEALIKELATGRFGEELKAQAKDLAEPLQKWEKQDVSRFNNDVSVTTLSRDDVVAGVKTSLSKFESAEPSVQKDAATPAPAPSKEPASAEQSTPANPEKTPVSASTATSQDAAASVKAEAAPAAKQEAAAVSPQEPTPAKVDAAQPAKMDAAPEVKAAPVRDAAAVAAKELAANRMTETESAGGKLSMMMANPAGSFTNRDKTWNQASIQRAATEVLRIDPESVSQLSGPQRAKLAAFSAWVAENARDGKLPGFDSAEGKAQASQLVDRAAALIGKMDEGSKLSPDVQKSLTKADNMVNAMEQLQKSASATNQTSREQVSRGGISSNAASALAKDLVHSVYRQPEMSDAQAKYLLKNAANLTPETTKAMDPQTRAQTAVAMGHLAQQVRDGAMGDFSKLPSSVQKNVVAASNAAETMLTQMGKDPSMRAELNQAYSELHAKNAGTSKTAGAAATKVDGMEQSTGTSPSAAKSTDASATKVDTGVTKADGGASKAAAPAATKSDGRSHDR